MMSIHDHGYQYPPAIRLVRPSIDLCADFGAAHAHVDGVMRPQNRVSELFLSIWPACEWAIQVFDTEMPRE